MPAAIPTIAYHYGNVEAKGNSLGEGKQEEEGLELSDLRNILTFEHSIKMSTDALKLYRSLIRD